MYQHCRYCIRINIPECLHYHISCLKLIPAAYFLWGHQPCAWNLSVEIICVRCSQRSDPYACDIFRLFPLIDADTRLVIQFLCELDHLGNSQRLCLFLQLFILDGCRLSLDLQQSLSNSSSLPFIYASVIMLIIRESS